MKAEKSSLRLIIMAAGVSQRYGKENKLLQDFDGKRLIDIVIDILPKEHFDSIIAVTSDDEISSAFKNHNIKTITNENPNRGIGSTVKLGLTCVGSNADGYMFLVCDQPFLSKQTIIELIGFWSYNTSSICSLAYGEKMGNPVIFPESLFHQLSNIDDIQSGKVVIDNNKNLLKKYYIKNQDELFDIDTISDLRCANQLKHNL